MIRHEDIDDGRLTSKCHKVWCCPSCCLPCNCMLYPCRKAVSGNKKRIREKGFDLDLAYVAPKIIVHGFPAAGIEHLYRNPRYEIRRFMDHNHKDHYKMYNFCCEPGRGYSPSVFHGRVERYPFKDHNTPPLESMIAFSNSVKVWLDKDPENVVSMHCKAGKGRAGLMCCVSLIRTGIAQSAVEALDIYDRERVTNNRGLTVTSQRKYVIFYEAIWRQCWGVTGNIGDIPGEPWDETKFPIPEQPELRLFGIEVLNIPTDLVGSFSITIFKISNFLPVKTFESGWVKSNVVAVDCNTVLHKNFKIFVKYKRSAFSSPVKLFELLHNTYFMDRYAGSVDFPIDQLDVKKKIKPLLGPKCIVRLKFTGDGTGTVGGSTVGVYTASREPFDGDLSGGTKKGYEKVGNTEESPKTKGEYEMVAVAQNEESGELLGDESNAVVPVKVNDVEVQGTEGNEEGGAL